MKKKYENMSDNEKTKYFATGRRAAQEVSKLVDGKFIKCWMPRVRGGFVRLEYGPKHYKTKKQALQAATEFRGVMRRLLTS